MKQQNIIIEYTKWLIKWLFGILLFTGLVFGGYYFYNDYQNQLIPMISLKCNKVFADGKALPDLGDATVFSYFMIKKRRKSVMPSGVFRAPHIMSSKVTNDTKVTDLFEIEPYYENHDDLYIFKEKYNNDHDARLEINRKDLSMRFMKSSPSRDEHKTFFEWECELITTEEFYTNEQIKLKALKKRFKI